jgi:hypothetical protein
MKILLIFLGGALLAQNTSLTFDELKARAQTSQAAQSAPVKLETMDPGSLEQLAAKRDDAWREASLAKHELESRCIQSECRPEVGEQLLADAESKAQAAFAAAVKVLDKAAEDAGRELEEIIRIGVATREQHTHRAEEALKAIRRLEEKKQEVKQIESEAKSILSSNLGDGEKVRRLDSLKLRLDTTVRSQQSIERQQRIYVQSTTRAEAKARSTEEHRLMTEADTLGYAEAKSELVAESNITQDYFADVRSEMEMRRSESSRQRRVTLVLPDPRLVGGDEIQTFPSSKPLAAQEADPGREILRIKACMAGKKALTECLHTPEGGSR